MIENLINIDGKFYIIDMDAVMKWVSETPNSEKNINTITTMNYPVIDGEEMIEKEVSETKSTLNEALNNVRYDFLRILLNTLFTTFANEMNQSLSLSINDLTFAQKIAFNTLVAKKIIIEVNL